MAINSRTNSEIPSPRATHLKDVSICNYFKIAKIDNSKALMTLILVFLTDLIIVIKPQRTQKGCTEFAKVFYENCFLFFDV